MKNIYKENDEVLYTKESIVNLTAQDLADIKKMAKLNSRQRIRICSHSSIDDKVHEMIIFHSKGTYVPPHKHLGKCESFHLISGEIDCVIFNNEGTITKTFPMGDYSSGKTFYYRIPADTFHTQLFTKDTFFHEVTEGPFNRDETIIASWAPDEKDTLKTKKYMSDIIKEFSIY
jgi:cupin fold WbuC family metalloprotein